MPENTITVVGNVTRDPELKYTASGKALLSIGVAVNKRKKVDGEWENEASFFDVTVWDTMAENVGESCPKGTRVIVTGRLEQRTWETKEGEKRSKVDITADEIGPSLRWASCHVTKADRTKPTTGASYGDEGIF